MKPTFRKAISYTGQSITDRVQISHKIDGIRILYSDNKFITRNTKTPPGFDRACDLSTKDKIKFYKDCEIYTGSFLECNSILQSHEPETNCISEDMIYPLDYTDPIKGDNTLDPRLLIDIVEKPTQLMINSFLKDSLGLGYEGLVLRTDKYWYRVKPKATADVFITGWFEQFDKNKNPKGQLGGFKTNYGNVTAFTDSARKDLWDNPNQYLGKLMEVEYKERYPSGSFRYAVKFLRFRDDKDTESFDGVLNETSVSKEQRT